MDPTSSSHNSNSLDRNSAATISQHLIVQTAFLGDLLLAIPFLKRLQKDFPQHRRTLVCRKGLADFFLRTQLIDEAFEIEKGNSQSYTQALETLKERSFDHIYCSHESLRSAFFCRQIKAQKKVAFKKWWNFVFFNERIEKPKQLPEALRQLSLLSRDDVEIGQKIKENLNPAAVDTFYLKNAEGLLSSPPVWASMSLREEILLRDEKTWTDLKSRMSIPESSLKSLVFVFPGSVWATKKWTEEGFFEVARALQKENRQVVFMGSREESPLTEGLAAKIPGALSWAGQTSIYETALALARGRLVLGNDSASSHLAAVADVPLISFFGPTVLKFGYRPWSNQAWVFENEKLSCRPCGSHGPQQCPLGTHECMKSIAPQGVLKKALEITR